MGLQHIDGTYELELFCRVYDGALGCEHTKHLKRLPTLGLDPLAIDVRDIRLQQRRVIELGHRMRHGVSILLAADIGQCRSLEA